MENQLLTTEIKSSAVSPLPPKMAWEQETFAAISILGVALVFTSFCELLVPWNSLWSILGDTNHHCNQFNSLFLFSQPCFPPAWCWWALSMRLDRYNPSHIHLPPIPNAFIWPQILCLTLYLLLKSMLFLSLFPVKREYSLLVGSCGVFSILLEEANILLTKGNL